MLFGAVPLAWLGLAQRQRHMLLFCYVVRVAAPIGGSCNGLSRFLLASRPLSVGFCGSLALHPVQLYNKKLRHSAFA
jgi:hypothetical protein